VDPPAHYSCAIGGVEADLEADDSAVFASSGVGEASQCVDHLRLGAGPDVETHDQHYLLVLSGRRPWVSQAHGLSLSAGQAHVPER
jgi:hypothetical protein